MKYVALPLLAVLGFGVAACSSVTGGFKNPAEMSKADLCYSIKEARNLGLFDRVELLTAYAQYIDILCVDQNGTPLMDVEVRTEPPAQPVAIVVE